MLLDNKNEPPEPPNAVWRIWSNTHQRWYRRDAVGYTRHAAESGLFTPAEALAIYSHASIGWEPTNQFPISVTLVHM